jgi:hypothetical protein
VPRRARVHPQQAPAEIDNLLVTVGEELRFDLVQSAAASGDDAGLLQNGEMFRDHTAIQFRAGVAKARQRWEEIRLSG